jgi:perosamine synthetase
MKIQRTLPPTAAPTHLRNLLHGLIGFFAGKKYLSKLEAEIKQQFGVKHVFLVSSGKAALTLILVALKTISPKRQVLIPAYTCFSVPSSIVKAGLEVSLCDIDPTTLDFNFDLLEKTIDERTLCVLPIHLLGLPSDVERVKALCQKRDVFVVEDAAQAMGGKYNGRLLGTFGDVAFFSLGRGKNITCGAGGIVLTNSDSIAAAVQSAYSKLELEPPLERMLNLLGVLAMRLLIDPQLYWLPTGLPFLKLGETRFYRDFPMHRIDGTKAGLLMNWKDQLERSNSSRCLTAREFMHRLAPNMPVIHPPSGEKTVYLRLPLLTASKTAKETLCALSKKHGLGISPLYPTAIQAIDELKDRIEETNFPVATIVAERLVTLPVHHLMTQNDLEKICYQLNNLHGGTSINADCTTRTISTGTGRDIC